jgi:DNA gyrase subunit A
MATKLGEVKRTALSEFASVRRNGLIAMNLEDGDELVAAALARETDDVIVVNNAGQSIRFKVADLRQASRQSGGVRGMKIGAGERVVAMLVPDSENELLTVTAGGFGKRTPLEQYPVQGRGGSGLRTHRLSDKTGELVAAHLVSPEQELMIISAEGIVLRTRVESIALYGRDSQGVHVMRVGPSDAVACIACVDMTTKQGDEPPQESGAASAAPEEGRPSRKAKGRAPRAAKQPKTDKKPGPSVRQGTDGKRRRPPR